MLRPVALVRALGGDGALTSVFGGAAFLDRETGLVWEAGQDPQQRPWGTAREVCMDKNIGDRKGWRLPAFNELTSLIDPTRTNPALPVGHPFQRAEATGPGVATCVRIN